MEASEGSGRQTPSVKWQESWWRRRKIIFFLQRPWPLLVLWQPWHRRRVRQKEHGAVRHAARHRSLSVGPHVTVIFLSDPSPCGIAGLTVKIAAPTHRCTGLPHPTVQEICECFMSAVWVLLDCFHSRLFSPLSIFKQLFTILDFYSRWVLLTLGLSVARVAESCTSITALW